ncbi:MAG: glycerol-3-phosphate acyltransferase [Chloroflexota bacterium]
MALSASTLYPLILATLLGYILGSIPLAALVSRRRGVDIFSAGTRLAGAANVARSVGFWHGGAVFWGDVAKGILTVVASHRLGVDGAEILLPGMAALVGHWRSVFARFRGGDGLATLVGITMALLPPLTFWLAVLTGTIVMFIARASGHHPTLWGGAASYSFLLFRASVFGDSVALVLIVVVLALMVLAHGVASHLRHPAST